MWLLYSIFGMVVWPWALVRSPPPSLSLTLRLSDSLTFSRHRCSPPCPRSGTSTRLRRRKTSSSPRCLAQVSLSSSLPLTLCLSFSASLFACVSIPHSPCSGWGIGSTLFGVGTNAVGNSLGFSLILGLTATLGSAIVLVVLHPNDIATKSLSLSLCVCAPACLPACLSHSLSHSVSLLGKATSHSAVSRSQLWAWPAADTLARARSASRLRLSKNLGCSRLKRVLRAAANRYGRRVAPCLMLHVHRERLIASAL